MKQASDRQADRQTGRQTNEETNLKIKGSRLSWPFYDQEALDGEARLPLYVADEVPEMAAPAAGRLPRPLDAERILGSER